MGRWSYLVGQSTLQVQSSPENGPAHLAMPSRESRSRSPNLRGITMLRVSTALLAVALALPALCASAQSPAQQSPAAGTQPQFEIRGRITDTANAPLPRASVTLRLKGSPVTIAGAIAGKDG